MKAFENEVKTQYWTCENCSRNFSFDQYGKQNAENCCICSVCKIENTNYKVTKRDFRGNVCEQCHLKTEISYMKSNIERQNKELATKEKELYVLEYKDSRKLEKLNESNKN